MDRSLRLNWRPNPDSHKGDNGRVLIAAGSRKYHGAAVFSILGARRFCDLVYFMPGEMTNKLISAISAIPECIMVESDPKADVLLIGPGLGDSDIDVKSLLRAYQKKVIDGDAFDRLLPRDVVGAVLTPHAGEFREFFGMEGTPENVKEMAARHKCTILRKGKVDAISDGNLLLLNKTGNAGMTKGGTGDVLAGLLSALLAKNSNLPAAYHAARINGYAGDMLYRKMGFSFCASDLAEILPYAYKKAVSRPLLKTP